MAVYKFTSPDGKTYRVTGPDGATPEQAFGVLRDHVTGGIDYSQSREQVRAAIGQIDPQFRDTALEKWAKAYVAKEKEDAGTSTAVADTGRAVARGTILGTVADELNAGTNAALNFITGGRFGAPYDESLAYQRERDRSFDEENPGVSLTAKLAGGLSGGVGAYRAANAVRGGGAGALTPAAYAVGGPFAAMGPGNSLLNNVGRGVVSGTAAGAVAGFGNAEGGLDQRLEGAQDGAEMGALFGAVLPPAIAGAGYVAGRVGDAVSPQIARLGAMAEPYVRDATWQAKQALRKAGIIEPPIRSGGAAAAQDGGANIYPTAIDLPAQAAADQMIANQLLRAGVSIDDVRSILNSASDAARMGPNSRAQNVLAPVDAEDALQRLAGSALRQQPEAGTNIRAFLRGRQTGVDPNAPMPETAGIPTRPALSAASDKAPPMGQYERIRDAIKRAFQIQDEDFHGHAKNAYRTEQQILTAARDEAKPLYKAAYKAGQGVDLAPTVLPILQKWRQLAPDYGPMGREIVKVIRAYERALRPGQMPGIFRFDKVKQWSDDMIDKARGNDQQKNLARLLGDMQRELLDAVDKVPSVGPAYQAARNAWAGRMQAVDALRLGQSLLKEGSEVTADQYAALAGNEGLQKLVRLGILDGFDKRMARDRRTTDVTKWFDRPEVENILRVVIPRSKDADATFANRPERFGAFIQNEQRMIGTRDRVVGNSATAERLADDQAYQGLTRIIQDIRAEPGVVNMTMKAAEVLLDKMFGMRPDTAKAIVNRLFTADPQEQARALAAIERRMAPSRAAQFGKLLSDYQRLVSQSSAVAGTAMPQQGGSR